MTVRIPVSRSCNWVLRWASSILLTVGCVGLGIYFWSELDAHIYQGSQNINSAATPVTIREPLEMREIGKAAEPTAPRLPWTPDPRLIGRMEIPRIQLSVLVRDGIDQGTLRRAVGHVPGTAMPGASGNFVVAGHRDTFFRKLRLIQRGDEIRLTTGSGIFRYRVEALMVVDPEAVEAMQPTAEASCTLITCFPFDAIGPAPRRMLVRARQLPY